MIEQLIIKKEKCTGCFACANICPTNSILMLNDNEGFWYPKVDSSSCIKCEKCVNICQIINATKLNKIPSALACKNKNDNIRFASSSGGMFTIVAEKVLKEKGVVFGAVFNKEFQVDHNYAESIDELKEFRGSKYVHSKIGNTYKQAEQFLKDGRTVLFTGTPCQIEGLKLFLRTSYNNLICVDILCHGVPSPKVWCKYLTFRQIKSKSAIQNISFRYKHNGWKEYSMLLLFKNGAKYNKNFRKDPYMQAFLKNLSLRPSCYICKYRSLHRVADITLADFWGVQHIYPDFDDDKGTSLVLINSEKGREVYNSISNQIYSKEADLYEIEKRNSLTKPILYNTNRNKFFQDANKMTFDKLVRKYYSYDFVNQTKRKIISAIKEYIIKLYK